MSHGTKAGKAQDEDAALFEGLAALRAAHGHSVAFDDIEEVARALAGSLAGEVTAHDVRITRELEGLARLIRTAKAEIAAIRPDEIGSDHIPAATDELDAIVAATEEATNAIMDATETIESMMDKLPQEAQDALLDATTRIYEACGFQDITGQRTGKVVEALKQIEAKVASLVAAVGGAGHAPAGRSDGTGSDRTGSDRTGDGADRREDVDLLNGPQLPENAVDQAEIDRLLSDFD